MTQVSNEHRRALADRDWWRAAGLVVGLDLRGWTFRDTASFIDTETDRTVELPGSVAKRLHTIAPKDGRWPVVAKDDAEHDAVEALLQTDIDGVPTASRHPLSIEGLRAIAAKQFGVNDPELCAELASELLSLRQSHSTAVVVKGLEWFDNVARTPFGDYWMIVGIDSRVTLGAPGWSSGEWKKYPTVEAARSAAQADYEQRISSALSPTDEDVEHHMPEPDFYSDGFQILAKPFNHNGFEARSLFTEQTVRAALVAALSRKG